MVLVLQLVPVVYGYLCRSSALGDLRQPLAWAGAAPRPRAQGTAGEGPLGSPAHGGTAALQRPRAAETAGRGM